MRAMVKFALGIVVASTAGVASAKEPAPSAAPAMDAQAAAQAPPAPQPQELSEREKALIDWRKKLSGSRWEIQTAPSAMSKSKAEQDTLVFESRRFTSDKLSKAGYQSSNYSLSSPTDKSVEWETMQTKEKGDLVIWRGGIQGETIQGFMTKMRKVSGKPDEMEEVSFTGHRAVEAQAEAAAPPAPGVPAEAAAAAPAPEASTNSPSTATP